MQILALLLCANITHASAESRQERPEWERFFQEAGATGTIVVLDGRTGEHFQYGNERTTTRYIPASTFKIPHALFALDAGIVHDEFDVFRWDGTDYMRSAWNADQTLRSSMRNSTVWVYRQFALQLGEERERTYLAKIGYGNADPSGGVDRFWLDGPLRISAVEQVEFLEDLYYNRLPFSREHQYLVKDIMIVEAGRDYIVRAKTGWGATDTADIGWWVGWVETTKGPVFFALNIDMPGKEADAPKRESIARAVLTSLGALHGQ
jgi:beta-lactamase class D